MRGRGAEFQHADFAADNSLERFPFALAHGTRSSSLFESVIHRSDDATCTDHALSLCHRGALRFRPPTCCSSVGSISPRGNAPGILCPTDRTPTVSFSRDFYR